MDISLFRKWIVEFIGTFFLVYVIACVSLQDHVLLCPLALGASLLVMLLAWRWVSRFFVQPLPLERFPEALSIPPSPLALLCWGWPTGRISGYIGLASF